MDEAEVLAQSLFRSQVEQHLTHDEITECRKSGAITSGSLTRDWDAIVGKPASDREFYEYQIYKPSNAHPYVEKIYAVILVSRSRDNESCYVQWMPPVEQHRTPTL